ncbi:2-dehydro-3-deoxygluconokinase [Catenulispora sp. GP43]|uniref:sugar kinase n=1 Tax=Catenulispora sp. GP43 TaxID=3156263 RepID=UPI0035154F1E
MTTPDVVTIGETMAALRATGPVRLGAPMNLSVAGAESTVAIGLARLGHRSCWIGRVGDDEFGALVLRTLLAEGVDVSHAHIDGEGRPTGLLARERRIGGLIQVSYYRGGSAGSALCPEDVLPALSPGVRLLHLTGITPALSPTCAEAALAAAREARELGITVSLDVNYRSRLWSAQRARETLLPLTRLADILIASADELHLVCADPVLEEKALVDALLTEGTRELVLTRGGNGADVFTTAASAHAEAHQVPVVDVVGAGDAFVAGYLSGLLDGLDLDRRLRRAVAAGAFAVAAEGDWEGLPTRDSLALLDHPSGTTLR